MTFNDKRGDGSNPRTALSLRSGVLEKHWTKHDSEPRKDRLTTAFRQARSEAFDSLDTHGYTEFSGRQVAGALRAMRLERACGLDHWNPSNWLNLPIKARNGVASTWPHQVMQNAVAILGKSAADDRPISLTSLLYAVKTYALPDGKHHH